MTETKDQIEINDTVEESVDNKKLIIDCCEQLNSSIIWLKIIAGFAIFLGILLAVTVVGVIIAWIPVILGLYMLQMTSYADKVCKNGDPDSLTMFFYKLKLSAMFTVLFIIVSVAIILLFYLVR